MAASFTLPTVLANLATGNQPLSLIDGDLNALSAPLLSLNTFSNFYTDTGAANSYVITVSSPQTVSQAAGLRVQFIAANANTGASALQINALAAKNIFNPDGTALTNGQISAGQIVDVIYDGTQYLLLGASYKTNTWTPVITFSTPGDLNVVYSTQIGTYTKIGREITAHFSISTSTFTHTTAAGQLNITGFPFTSANIANMFFEGPIGIWQGVTKVGYTSLGVQLANNSTLALVIASGSAQAASSLTSADMPTGGSVVLRGTALYHA